MQSHLATITKDTLFHALEPYSSSLTKVYSKLNLRKSNTELISSPVEINKLVNLVTRESSKPLLPYVLGWNYPTSRASDMFLAMSTASNVSEALNILKTYYQSYSLFGECISIDNSNSISLKISFPWSLSENISLQKMACSRIQRLLYDVFSHQFMPIKATNVSFAEEMCRFFKISPMLTDEQNAVIFYYPNSCYSLNIPSSDLSAFNHFKNKLKRSRIAIIAPENNDPVLATERLFDIISPTEWSKERFSTELGVTVRHYERVLQKQKTSFNVLVKRKIQEIATNGIISGDSIDFLATHLGYSERKSFERAFKAMTGVTPKHYKELVFKIRFDSLKNNILNNKRIPLFSNTTSKLIEFCNSSQRSIEDICNTIEPEPVLVARIMSYASSAFYASFQVKNLKEAVSKCLGIDSVVSLSMSIMTNLGRSPYGFSVFSPASVWSQILITSEIVLLLRKSFPTKSIDWNSIYFCSLFKDIGLIYLLDSCENEIAARFESDFVDQHSFTEMNDKIRERFGTSPYSLSTLILLRWGTDKNIQNMIRTLDTESTNLSQEECALLAMAEKFALHIRTMDVTSLTQDVEYTTRYLKERGVRGVIDISKIDEIAAKIKIRTNDIFT